MVIVRGMILCVFALMLNGIARADGTVEKSTSMHSAPETIDRARTPPNIDESINHRKEYKLAASPWIYKLFDHPDFPQQRDYLGMMIGVTGNEEDVPKLVDYIRSQKGKTIAKDDELIITGAIYGLGALASRGVSAASEALDSMMDMAYWKNLKIRVTGIKKEPADISSWFLRAVLMNKAISKDPGFLEKCEQCYKRLQDPKNNYESSDIKRLVYYKKSILEKYRGFNFQAPH